jgi:kynurenine formamidase
MTFPYKVIDLTHTLDEKIPSWSSGCGFKSEIKLDYSEGLGEVKFRVQQIKMHAGIGTHLDAPAHCIEGGLTIDQLSLSNLIAPTVVIDVSGSSHEHYSVTVDDIEAFEETYGTIQPHSFVMVKTGWEQFWNDPQKYHNGHLFPSVSKEAAKFLLDRQIVGLGIDTLSPDRPADGYPVHALLLGERKYIIENAANLAELPPIGCYTLALPIKIKEATEAPIRLIGLIKNS